MTESLLVLSPHLDDAALSCSWLLSEHPGSTSVTLYAGQPRNARLCTQWDRECGFQNAREAIMKRRREDAQALRRLFVQHCWLDAIDGQYAEPQSDDFIDGRLRAVFLSLKHRRPVVPMGLHHPDHIACSNSAIRVLRALATGQKLWCYEDVPYRRVPGAVKARVETLERAGFRMRSHAGLIGSIPLKTEVLSTYRSQWPRLNADRLLQMEDAFAPERLWEMEEK